METVFENEYLLTDDMTREYVYRVIYMKQLIAGYAACIVGILLFFLYKDNLSYMVLAAAIICGFTALVAPILTTRQMNQMAKKLHGGERKPTVVRFGDKITMDEGSIHLEFSSDQLIRMKETPRLLALQTGPSSSILVTKDGFTKGDLESFKTFILEKIPKKK